MTVSLPEFSGSSEQVAIGGVPKGSNEESIVAAVRRVTEAATDFTWLAERPFDLPVLHCLGARDPGENLLAGLCSSVYSRGVGVLKQCLDGLDDFMDRKGYQTIKDFQVCVTDQSTQ